MPIAVHTNLYYDDGTVIATDAYYTPVFDIEAYTAQLADVAGASYARTLAYDDRGARYTYASYDGKWVDEL